MTGVDRQLTKKGQKKFLDRPGFEPGTKKVSKTLYTVEWCLTPLSYQDLVNGYATFYIFNLLEVACYLLYKTVWFSFVLFETN